MTEESRFEILGPLERKGTLKGLGVLAGAVLIGILLMPSATRPPALVNAASANSTTTTTTLPSGVSTATTTATSLISSMPQTTTVAPSSVHVLVANGTNTSGAAGAVSTFLSSKGFSLLKAANALTTVSATQLYAVGSSAAASAAEVATFLGLPTNAVQAQGSPPPVSSTSGADVVVIVGPELAGRFVGTSAGGATTSTSRPASGASGTSLNGETSGLSPNG